MGKTVFVGLSGGVDSAVSAMLLKERGFNVVGVFIKIWQPEFLECTWSRDRVDAMRAAVAIGIPFREIDLSDDYKKDVVEKMVSAYASGITPNPDVLCNRHIKFGSFLKYAEKEGADFIATGHYARIVAGNRPAIGKSLELLRGSDKNKDQSYFLYTLEQADLARTLFPIGDMEKSEVRARARRARLPVAGKPDSQGLCFVGDVTMKEFLSRYMALKKGAVLDASGGVIGEHEGAQIYTIGQRHGFAITKPARGTAVYYVVGTDVKNNTISVSENINYAKRKQAILDSVHFIDSEQSFPFEAEAQTRYREIPVKSVVNKTGEKIIVSFAEAHIVSPGQSLVLYKGDKCLGGGVITK
ncbi:MAG: tRNA 2-thiouridine(34) synthase MnmA [Candidatus Kaiserbacteria bacterium]|nr:tRNA 2-thiouridine(34) synthase MnmA [Candidatus Kaiserbacteria bacterium]